MDSNPIRILVINPNTSQHMTTSLKPVVKSLGFKGVEFEFFTCPSPGFASINSPSDAIESAKICLPHLIPLLPHHDAFLVACYSQHPLVPQLKEECDKLSKEATKGSQGRGARKYVTGIFEASVMASLALVGPFADRGFGIVSTGKVWETALLDAVNELLGTQPCQKFLGCETTGLNADELHKMPQDLVNQRMQVATKKLLKRATDAKVGVHAICLGCAGMVGLEEAVRSACLEELGEEAGKEVSIIDGVKAGIGVLVTLARCAF